VSSAPEVVVRDARADERIALRELTLSAYAQYATIMAPSAWTGLRDAILSALSTDPVAQQIVAEQHGRILGSVLLFPPSTDAYGASGPRTRWPEIRLLAVAPEARGLGIGKQLVAECVRRARDTGAAAVGLHTSRSMREAIQLYERAGFVRDPDGDIQVEGTEAVEAYRLTLPVT
jgi:GNAT superfamily N-acetyltransferase